MSRGRVWTAGELLRVVPVASRDVVRTITIAKLTVDGDIVEVTRRHLHPRSWCIDLSACSRRGALARVRSVERHHRTGGLRPTTSCRRIVGGQTISPIAELTRLDRVSMPPKTVGEPGRRQVGDRPLASSGHQVMDALAMGPCDLRHERYLHLLPGLDAYTRHMLVIRCGAAYGPKHPDRPVNTRTCLSPLPQFASSFTIRARLAGRSRPSRTSEGAMGHLLAHDWPGGQAITEAEPTPVVLPIHLLYLRFPSPVRDCSDGLRYHPQNGEHHAG